MSTRDSIVMDGFVAPQFCVVCGDEKPGGIWVGSETVAVCRTCAREVLPLLIADAVSNGRRLDVKQMREVASDVAGRLWRGLALAAARQR